MQSLTITLPLPPREVSQNARCHWRKKSPITKARRKLVQFSAMEAMQWNSRFRGAGESYLPPMWDKASVKIRAYFKTRRWPDASNFIGQLKADFDGLEDAKVIKNDRGLWPERPEFFTDKNNPRVEITITPES